MPLSLTTPVSSGDLDPNASNYAKLKVIEFNVSLGARKSLRFTTQMGNVVDDVWVPGIAAPVSFALNATQFDALASTHATEDGELTYDAVARGLYEWLVSEGHYAGTID